jgi:hypothetical protein
VVADCVERLTVSVSVAMRLVRCVKGLTVYVSMATQCERFHVTVTRGCAAMVAQCVRSSVQISVLRSAIYAETLRGFLCYVQVNTAILSLVRS